MERPLHHGLVLAAGRNAQRVAIDAPSGSQTYGELFARGCAIAATLVRDRERADEPLCAVLAPRDLGAFEAIAGVLLSGHGYVPLNPAFPAKRTAEMLARSETNTLVVDAECVALLDQILPSCERVRHVVLPRVLSSDERCRALLAAHTRVRWTCSDQLADMGAWVAPEVSPDAVAYLLFTSGSTGTPKGVMVAQRNIRHFLDVMQERYRLTPADRLSQMFELVFDLSLFDIFMTWEAGARLCVPSRRDVLLPAAYITEKALTVWFSVPSAAQIMQRLRLLEEGAFPSLRLSLFCGEALPCDLARAWALAASNSIVENLYGPTELTLACTLHRWAGTESERFSELGMVPIGDPYPGMQALVVDNSLSEVETGDVGELLMSGPQTAPGYWRDPGKTQAAFVQLAGRPDVYYRTGDLVRRPNPDQPLVHLGRSDQQIKIQGHRVELGEIEAVLREVSQVDQVAVVPHPIVNGAVKGLVAFLRADDIDEARVKQLASAKLPSYMVPTRIEALPELPLNPNGKLDRSKLKARLQAEVGLGSD